MNDFFEIVIYILVCGFFSTILILGIDRLMQRISNRYGKNKEAYVLRHGELICSNKGVRIIEGDERVRLAAGESPYITK